MAETFAWAAFWVFAGSVLWLIWAGYGWHRGTLKDPTDIVLSWKRVVPPSVLGGLAFATHAALLPATPPRTSHETLIEWAVLAAVFTAGCLLSGLVMIGIARRGRELQMRDVESGLKSQ